MMQIYAPTIQADEKDIEKFFEKVKSIYKKK